MVIDSSAILAILLDEPERGSFDREIALDPLRLVSAVSRVEAGVVIESRKGAPGRRLLETFLRMAEVDVVAVTPEHAELALDAYRRFGKGRHPAGLNIGDCFSYAAARATGQKLLFKGDDFARTDITPVLPA